MAGAGSITTLARTASKIRRASSRPLMTLTLTPVSASMRSTTATESRASRNAAVAHTTISSAPLGFRHRPEARGPRRPRRRPPASPISPGGRHHAAEAEHLLVGGHRLEGPVGVGVGHQEMERVAPQVERGDPHALDGTAAEERSTGMVAA